MNNNNNLISKAKTFYQNKNFFEAKELLLKALEDKHIDKTIKSNLYILLADICYKINDFKETEHYLIKSLENGKSSAEIFNLLGNVYLKLRNYKNSEKYYLNALKLEEENEVSLINLAILYHNLGKKNKAIDFYKKVLKKNPRNIGALHNLSNLDEAFIDKKKLFMLKDLITSNDLDDFNLASCYFLLSKIKKKKKDFSEEFNLLKYANNFSFRSNKLKNTQLNEYWLNRISKKYNKISLDKNLEDSFNTKNIYPIFIIGLPRCGSTLLESIISSGTDKIDNFGETNLVNWAFLNTNKNFLSTSNQKNEKIKIDLNLTAKRLISSFSNLISNKNTEKIFFLEKSLENFYYIDLIFNIYPNAKFINPNRNIIDNIFAIYKQFLPNISWSHSIENILSYIDNYLSVIDHFKTKYPDKILSISLEDFTNNPKKLSKKIYKFCNLRWNDKCLNFYNRNDLFINTASNNQIRTSVKKYNNKKYKPYKKIIKNYFDKYSWLKD